MYVCVLINLKRQEAFYWERQPMLTAMLAGSQGVSNWQLTAPNLSGKIDDFNVSHSC